MEKHMFQTSGFNREKEKPSRTRVSDNRCKVGFLRLTSSPALCSESETRKVDLIVVTLRKPICKLDR